MKEPKIEYTLGSTRVQHSCAIRDVIVLLTCKRGLCELESAHSTSGLFLVMSPILFPSGGRTTSDSRADPLRSWSPPFFFRLRAGSSNLTKRCYIR
jgi:hypothetical protein